MKLKSKIKNFFKNKKNKKIFIIVTTIISALIVIVGTTLAYVSFTLTSSKDNLIKVGCLKISITDKDKIELTSSIPMLDEKGLELTPYTYTINNTCTVDAYYETNLGIVNTSNLDNVSKVKLSLAGDTYLYPVFIGSLNEGTLLDSDSTISKAYLMDTGYIKAGSSKTFELRMWINSEVESMTGTMDAKVIVNATAKSGPEFNSYTSGYKAISNTSIIEPTNANPNYAYPAPYTDSNDTYSQSSGIIRVSENDNDVYYFRGNIESNYLTFAGFTWRIIKVNSDGSIKIALDVNTTTEESEEGVVSKTYDSSEFTNNLTSAYNSTTTTSDSLNYSNSLIKTKLESWYNTNLSSYESYIIDTTFCNDMTNSNNYYGAYTRNISSHNPNGVCTSTLTAKIGTLAADELSYAGIATDAYSSDNYLYHDFNYWTMSPSYFNTDAYVLGVTSGKLESVKVDDSRVVIPVITISKNALLSGTGSLDNMFHVIGTYGEKSTYSDTTPPIINYVRTNVNGQIEISATDGAFGTGIAGYYIGTSNTAPTLTDEGWITKTSEKYITTDVYNNGTYYVFAKDGSGNISDGKTLAIEVADTSKIKPKLTNNLIPVYYDETAKVWKKADNSNVSTKYKWYDYANKKWANAVTVYENSYEDESANDIEITIDGATPTNNGLVFDGTDDAVEVYDGFGVTLPATYSVTFKTTSLENGQVVFGDYDTKIAFGIGASTLVVTIGSDAKQTSFYPKDVLDVNKWYTATIVANSLTDIKLYINGVEQTASISGSANYWLWTSGSYIGRRYYSDETQNYFSGTIKNLMVWDRALSKSEVNSIYTNYQYKSVPKDDLTTYFDFTKVRSRDYYTNASAGTVIPISSINTMWVWIPRFSATSSESYNGGTSASPGAFNIKFVSTKEKAHDAFTLGSTELSGFWASKFEPSSNTSCTAATGSSSAGCDLTTISPLIKPNMTSWRGARVSTFYTVGTKMKNSGNIYGLSTSTDTHMMKNSEWAAIAYLTQSLYGRCTSSTSCVDVTINNCSTYKTGIAGDTVDASSSSTTCTDSNNKYKTTKGVLASTTGNVYGIYDMVGGSWESVMGNYSSTIDASGFSSLPSLQYLNTYTTTDAYTTAGLQHALEETSGWYGNTYTFPSSSNTWVSRSGGYANTTYAGLFYTYDGYTGKASVDASTRYTLAIN